ncbi:hypothetical protein HU200_027370 [Digitaria exilis]|uniref:MLO-like protein n=1 Tax=Digitaria exilis TaxID=1010633 RepID=A0A835BXS7_9POAL|nr:hypothetical protein HU200_027370 [Digitaria exilis]
MPEETSLEGTPTWIVAAVCSVIVLISLVFERALHHLGKSFTIELTWPRGELVVQALEHMKKETSYEALLKLKEELMLLGFVSLLLVVFQDAIREICIDESLMERWLPCRAASPAARHRSIFSIFRDGAAGARRMLGGIAASGYCSREGEVPLLSLHTLEQIHIFSFVLAITHVVLSAVTVLLGLLQMRKWMHWENAIQEEGDSGRTMRSFFKQFYGSVSNDDYVAMRLGFVMEHIRGHPKSNFYDYMIKALEKDFKRVVGIKDSPPVRCMHGPVVHRLSWRFSLGALQRKAGYAGWHSNFWFSLIPIVLLLLIGAKLEHIINKLAYEVATKNFATDEQNTDMVLSPSDELNWFQSPRLVLTFIHIILFQNAFEFAYFFWTLICHPNDLALCVSVFFSVVVEVLCSYSTLPLYAIVTHMGSSFKRAVFGDDVAEHIRGWADGARRRNMLAATASNAGGLGTAAEEPRTSYRMPEWSQPTLI